MLKQLLVVISFMFSLACKGQGGYDDLYNRICEIIEAYDAIGASVAVVKENRICYQQSFGYHSCGNNFDRRDTIPSDGIFRIASISKTFVAAAIMQLAERGFLSLDDDINKYLHFEVRNPLFPQEMITVRMLLSHLSGITDFEYGKQRNSLSMFSSLDSLEKQQFFTKYKPGSKFNYSNYGYNLLGAIIENVTQKRFDQYIEENILNPLAIQGNYNVSVLDSSKFVWSYQYDNKRNRYVKALKAYKPIGEKLEHYVLGESTAVFSPCGGMKITIEDLARFMMAHMNYGTLDGNKILSKESEEEMMKIVSHNYGLGFMHSSFKLKNVDMVGHQGGAYGFHGSMFFSPDGKYGFIVLCNGCKGGHKLDSEIVRALYHHFINKE